MEQQTKTETLTTSHFDLKKLASYRKKAKGYFTKAKRSLRQDPALYGILVVAAAILWLVSSNALGDVLLNLTDGVTEVLRVIKGVL